MRDFPPIYNQLLESLYPHAWKGTMSSWLGFACFQIQEDQKEDGFAFVLTFLLESCHLEQLLWFDLRESGNFYILKHLPFQTHFPLVWKTLFLRWFIFITKGSQFLFCMCDVTKIWIKFWNVYLNEVYLVLMQERRKDWDYLDLLSHFVLFFIITL